MPKAVAWGKKVRGGGMMPRGLSLHTHQVSVHPFLARAPKKKAPRGCRSRQHGAETCAGVSGRGVCLNSHRISPSGKRVRVTGISSAGEEFERSKHRLPLSFGPAGDRSPPSPSPLASSPHTHSLTHSLTDSLTLGASSVIVQHDTHKAPKPRLCACAATAVGGRWLLRR